MTKPFSQACVNNRDPILAVLREHFRECKSVLEFGSGTGQHAVYFAQHLPHLVWHTGDLASNHAGIQMWLDECGLDNVRSPLELDAFAPAWQTPAIDGAFSANTTHIMPWEAVGPAFSKVAKLLPKQAPFVLYGPFNRHGNYTSESN